MSPDGIHLVEIKLNLPDTLYYLHWEPWTPRERLDEQRALLHDARAAGRRMHWKILAAGVDSDAVRLLFETTVDNLDAGLAVLLESTRRHRLYLVQPETALSPAAAYIDDHNAARLRTTGASAGGGAAALPDVHYGLFMGERGWARRMVDLLTSRSTGSPDSPRRTPSLAEIRRRHDRSTDAIVDAYRSGRFSLKDIAGHFGMHFSEVSAVVNAASMQSTSTHNSGLIPPFRD